LRIKRALGIWGIGFVLSLLILTPVYSTVGIGFKKLQFQFSAFLFLIGVPERAFTWALGATVVDLRLAK
jgi:hypothetical protein